MATATASTTGTSAVTMYTHREKFYLGKSVEAKMLIKTAALHSLLYNCLNPGNNIFYPFFKKF